MTSWAFTALGTPAPQGSKRHVGHGVMVESSKKVLPWREAVKAAAPSGPMLDGPVAVRMVFTLQRPASARKTEHNPYRTPDLSKLARATEDACTDAGLWADDARVSEYVRLAKVWSGYDAEALHVPGVAVAAIEMAGTGWRAELLEALESAIADRWALR
jgi:Holliday junction resolvase RusA-like endonuclease